MKRRMERDVVGLTFLLYGFERWSLWSISLEVLFFQVVLFLASTNWYACKPPQKEPGWGRPSTPVEDYLENQYIRAIFFSTALQCPIPPSPCPQPSNTHVQTVINSHQDCCSNGKVSFMENIVARSSGEPLMTSRVISLHFGDDLSLHTH